MPISAEPQGGCVTQTSPQILWWHDLDAPSFGSAAVGDIDADGRAEVVFGTYFNDEHIYALNAEDGSTLWSFDTGGCNDASVAIADVDLDGSLEVVVPASSPSTVYCFNGATGAVEWSRFVGASNCIDSPPGVADLDGDTKPEVVFGTFGGNVFCLAGEDGSVQWQRNLGATSYIQTCPTLVDLDGNQQLEVVVAQWQGDSRVYALHGQNGTVKWSSSAPTDWIYHGASSGDLDEDGRPELAIGCYDNSVYVLNGEDGSLLWSYPTAYYVGAPTSLADLNNDGHLEIVFVSYNTVGVLSRTGSLLWSYPTGGNVFRGVAIADVDGDTTLDVAFGCDDGVVRVLSGDTGSVIWTYDLQAHYGDTFEMDHAPVLADLNGDGLLDLFIVGGYGSSSQPASNHGRAYALSAGTGVGPGWPMFHHDLVHSGRFQGQGSEPPVLLTVSGPTMGKPGVEYTFGAVIADPEGSEVFCLWDFGDGSTSGWLGPYPSGSTCFVDHSWEAEGVNAIKVKLRDGEGVESAWLSACSFIVDGSSPDVQLLQPKVRTCYLGNWRSFPFLTTVVIGTVTVQVTVQDSLSGPNLVEFIVDGTVRFADTEAPYEWQWAKGQSLRCALAVAGYDGVGNRVQIENLTVWKFG